MMYASLVKQLNLSPEQADKFYNVLVDNELKACKRCNRETQQA